MEKFNREEMMKKFLLASCISLSLMSAHIAEAQPLMSMYWCGPDAGCGGQSVDFSDVNPSVNYVFVAFGLIDANGNVSFTLSNMSPSQFTQAVQQLQAQGKKIILSLGGENANWQGALDNPQTFISTLYPIMQTYGFDGVDMDIEGPSLASQAQSNQLINLINTTRSTFNTDTKEHLLITVSPEATTVVNNIGVIGGGWNTMVPVVDQAINNIDFIQVQAYNDNPFGDTPGTEKYLTDIYNDWIQPFSLGSITYNGMSPNKLILGMPASNSAANSDYYPGPAVISSTITDLRASNSNFAGVMFWDSHWDAQNNNEASNAAASAL